MVRRPARRRRRNSTKTHLGQIKRINKLVDRADRVVLVNKIIEAFGQQRPLPTIRLFNEAPHRFPRKNHRRIITAARCFHTARVKSGGHRDHRASPGFLRRADMGGGCCVVQFRGMQTEFSFDHLIRLQQHRGRRPNCPQVRSALRSSLIANRAGRYQRTETRSRAALRVVPNGAMMLHRAQYRRMFNECPASSCS